MKYRALSFLCTIPIAVSVFSQNLYDLEGVLTARYRVVARVNGVEVNNYSFTYDTSSINALLELDSPSLQTRVLDFKATVGNVVDRGGTISTPGIGTEDIPFSVRMNMSLTSQGPTAQLPLDEFGLKFDIPSGWITGDMVLSGSVSVGGDSRSFSQSMGFNQTSGGGSSQFFNDSKYPSELTLNFGSLGNDGHIRFLPALSEVSIFSSSIGGDLVEIAWRPQANLAQNPAAIIDRPMHGSLVPEPHPFQLLAFAPAAFLALYIRNCINTKRSSQ